MDIHHTTEMKLGESYFIKALLVGGAGGGKTTSAATLPGRKLLIDLDNGKEVLLGREDVDYVDISEPSPTQPKAYQQLEKLRQEMGLLLREGKFPYQSVIFDSGTRLYEVALNYVMMLDASRNSGGSPTTNHWVLQKSHSQKMIEWLIHQPFHLVVTMHETLVKDELSGQVIWMPAITGKDAAWIPRRFREVYHCFATSKKDSEGKDKVVWRWRTAPENQRPFLKSSLNTGSKYWPPVVEPDFATILKLRGL